MPSDEPCDDRCGAKCRNGGYCTQYPVTGSERCRMHGGTVGEDHGAPEDNQNAQTHALFSERDGYYQDLEDDEQQWVFDFTNDLLDRHRRINGREPDMFDKEALKNIAIDFHRVATANDWFRKNGLVNVDYEDTPQVAKKTTKVNVWAKEIRQYNESVYRRMKKHGLLEDPDSQKADAMEGIISILSSEVNNVGS